MIPCLICGWLSTDQLSAAGHWLNNHDPHASPDPEPDDD